MGYLSKIKFSSQNWNNIKEKLIFSGIYEDGSLTPLSEKIDVECKNIISIPLKSGNIKGSFGKHYSFYVDEKLVVLIGLGNKKDFDVNKVRIIAGKASRLSIAPDWMNLGPAVLPKISEARATFSSALSIACKDSNTSFKTASALLNCWNPSTVFVVCTPRD